MLWLGSSREPSEATTVSRGMVVFGVDPMRVVPLLIPIAFLVLAACGTTEEKTVVVQPAPGSTVVVPPSGDTQVVPAPQ